MKTFYTENCESGTVSIVLMGFVLGLILIVGLLIWIMNILSSVNSFQESEALILSEKSISNFMKSRGNLENVKNEVANKYNNDIETSQLNLFLKNAHVEYKEDSREEGNYNAILTPGIWFYGESKDICSDVENKKGCPCKILRSGATMWSGPCFHELLKDDIQPKNPLKQPQQPNAFRVKLQLPNASILKMALTEIPYIKYFLEEEFLKSKAIATLKSQNVVVLLDVSKTSKSSVRLYLSAINELINQMRTTKTKYGIAGDKVGFVVYTQSASVKELNSIDSVDLSEIESMAKVQEDGLGNLPNALNQAFSMISKDADMMNKDNHIIISSDGLTLCSQKLDCSFSEEHFYASLLDLEDVAEKRLEPFNNIKIHFIGYSDLTKPHTLLLPNGGGCLTEKQYRTNQSLSESFVNPNGVAFPDDKTIFNEPFYGSNTLYHMILSAGGIWGPLRNPCIVGMDITKKLDDGCNKNILKGNLLGIVGIDEEGRLLCDQYGRNLNVQISAYISDILKRSFADRTE